MGDTKLGATSPTLWLTISWREDIVLFQQLSPGASFVLGETPADFAFPASLLGVGRATLLSSDEGGRSVLALLDAFDDASELCVDDAVCRLRDLREREQTTLTIAPGFSASLHMGDFIVHLACDQQAPAATGRKPFDRRLLASHAAVGALATCVMVASYLAPVTGDRETEREELARWYLRRVAAAEQVEAEELEVEQVDPSQEGGTGTRAKGAEGAMGDPAVALENRYGVSGPNDPHVSRGAAIREAAEFGMIGLLSAGASGTAAWGVPTGLPQNALPLSAAGTQREPASGENYADYGINGPTDPSTDPVSTFAVDVDTGSYSIARRKLRDGHTPPSLAVRAEEFLNYFDYGYLAPPAGQDVVPFLAHIDAAPSPYESGHHLVRVGVQAMRIKPADRKPVHLVYLVDTSGSMSSFDKLGLAQRSLKMLTKGLKAGDTVALCTYAGSVREVLPPTGVSQRGRIMRAIDELHSGGSTAMESGIDLAYRLAERTLSADTTTRVVVLSDGDANVGARDHEGILRTIRSYRGKGITLSTVGFGTGNYNDVMMEQLADAGDGNYNYVDDEAQARRLFVEQIDGLLEVVARDMKIQVEFDRNVVTSYRLIGYDNRDVADEDFRDDTVDGGEVGAGHSVTALYDVELKPYRYASSHAWLRVHIRHKAPTSAETASETVFEIDGADVVDSFAAAPASFRFAAAVAGFAEVLRHNPHAKQWDLDKVATIAERAKTGSSDHAELIELVERARQLM